MTSPSSFRPSSTAYNLTLPYKYRRKSLTADDADITNRVPGLSSGGSSCSSSPIASSAILSSRNADSPTEYAPSEDEIWSDARYMGYASRVPFQHKRYDRRYAQAMPYLSRQTTPCVHHQYGEFLLCFKVKVLETVPLERTGACRTRSTGRPVALPSQP